VTKKGGGGGNITQNTLSSAGLELKLIIRERKKKGIGREKEAVQKRKWKRHFLVSVKRRKS